MSKVSILNTSPEKVIADYKRLLDLSGFSKVIKRSKESVIKLNLSWSKYFPSCSTEPWQLDGLLNYMGERKYDKDKITAAENKTVVTDIKKGLSGNRWRPLLNKYGIKFVPLPEIRWTAYKPKAEMIAMDKIFPEGHKIPEFFIGKQVIHLPTVKTHGHTMMTGAMKNAFGGLITERRHHCHKMIDEVLVDLLQIQKEIHPNIFSVMDGTVCGDGSGPRTMAPKIKNYILASDDQVAIDAVSAKMMGYDPLKIKFIKIAHDKGLGMGDIRQIDIDGISYNDLKKINFHFKTNKSPVIFFDQLFRRKVEVIEKILFHTPLFRLAIFGSEMYHDHLWYNVIGKKRIRRFMNTPWGKLWQRY